MCKYTKRLVMRKETKHKCHPTQAQRKEAHLLDESGPSQMENKTKPRPNFLQMVPNYTNTYQDALKRSPTKAELNWTQLGCGHTQGVLALLLPHLRPNFRVSVQ